MDSKQNISSIIESIAAGVLAISPRDIEAKVKISVDLAKALESLDSSSLSAQAVTLALQVFHASCQGLSPQSPELMNAVAAALISVSEHTANPNSQTEKTLKENYNNLQVFLQTEPTQAQQAPQDNDRSSQNIAIDIDPELLQEFIAEALDHVATAESSLLNIETKGDDPELINATLRAFHTVKGASAFLGLKKINKLAHSGENLLAKARNGEIKIIGEYADLALQSCDVLKKMIQSLDDQATKLDFADDLDRLLANLSNLESLNKSEPKSAKTQAPESDITQEKQNQTKASTESTVRVSTKRLDDLIDMVGELVIAQSMVAQDPSVVADKSSNLTKNIAHAGKIVRELQDITMALRLVPLKATFAKMTRVARDLARKSGKTIKFVTSGEETEIDRNMVQVLNDPLVHMIRNAVDHGIECDKQRSQKGKEPAAEIRLHAYHSAGNVIIELSDNGRGLDKQKILAKAIELGLTQPGRELTESDIFSLIFQPGFSTAEKVTDISGRGVGLDVANQNITALHGRIEVQSESNTQTTFTIRLPLTMAITDAMLVRVGQERYLLPTINIDRTFWPQPGSISTVAGRGEMVMYRDKLIPILRLHKILDLNGATEDPHKALLVVVKGRRLNCALLVDELLGHQQAVIKSLGKALTNVTVAAGGAILGDGQVGIILDTDSLIDFTNNHDESGAA